MMDEEDDMRGVSDMRDVHAKHDWTRFTTYNPKSRRRFLYGGIGLVALILVIVISICVSSGNRNNKSEQPTYATIAEEKKELFALVEDSLLTLNLSTDDLLLTSSYQYKAFQWLSENTNLEAYDDSHKLQRFALACFYFATFQVATKYVPQADPWVYQEYWLTDKHECDWAGVHCTAFKRIHSISLERNNLTGKLPFELALLGYALKGLDLSQNSITMTVDDMEVFRLLPKLEKLLLDDNFLVSSTGLPTSLETCTDLRKLRLSYNLLDGPLDNGVLNNLQKLTHLEIENNFLTGALPFLGNMAELHHIYLRHNALNAHLNFFKTTESHNIKELWLDGNPISGPIPSQIGKLTRLESLSITDAQLTGTLPTQIGHLTNLKHVWLSNNKLSGDIPSQLIKLMALELLEVQENDLKGEIPDGVCSIVTSSEYEQKAIMADCNMVKCSCCTECGG